ncbi:MAG: hypothetical protein K6A44_06395 [bacterium]|nr:hypothetical protein [bacterium]
MKIQNINLNLFRTRSTNETQNPFAANNVSNPFAGGLKTDIFQSSSMENKQPNIFAKKAAEIVEGWNQGVTNFKNGAKEFFAPAISFAGKIQAGYDKLNSIKMEDLFTNLKNEISMIGLDKDVKKYLKMSAADLRGELAKELAA